MENPGERRNWLELPRDVMILIFLKLGVIDLLCNAQFVCSSWLKLAKEPQLFRCVNLRKPQRHLLSACKFDPVEKAMQAIDRSCGQLIEFSMAKFGNEALLRSIAKYSTALKCLRLELSYEISEHALIDVLKRLPTLEEFYLCHCSFTDEVIKAAGTSCPGLQSFSLIHVAEMDAYSENGDAFAIAAYMPQLYRLQLFGNKMNNDGLQAILDKCRRLDYLDLRQCFSVNLNLNTDLHCEVEKIKEVRFPDDSFDDSEFDTSIIMRAADDHDYDSDYYYDCDYDY